jgi:hypothetical protein
MFRIIKSKRMMWAGNVARTEEKRVSYRLSIVEPVRKRPLVRPSPRCADNIKMNFAETGWGGVQ